MKACLRGGVCVQVKHNRIWAEGTQVSSLVRKYAVCEETLVSLNLKLACIVAVSTGHDSAIIHLTLFIYLYLKRGLKIKQIVINPNLWSKR